MADAVWSSKMSVIVGLSLKKSWKLVLNRLTSTRNISTVTVRNMCCCVGLSVKRDISGNNVMLMVFVGR